MRGVQSSDHERDNGCVSDGGHVDPGIVLTFN